MRPRWVCDLPDPFDRRRRGRRQRGCGDVVRVVPQPLGGCPSGLARVRLQRADDFDPQPGGGGRRRPNGARRCGGEQTYGAAETVVVVGHRLAHRVDKGTAGRGQLAEPGPASAALGEVAVLVTVVGVVTDEVGERDQVGQLAVAQVPQAVGGVHRAVERRVAGQRPLGPLQRLVQPADLGQGAGDVRVDRQVVRVQLDGPTEGREAVAGPARAAVRVPEPHLAHFRGLCAYPSGGPADRQRDLAETPGQRGRRAQQQTVLGVNGDRVAGQREVRRQGAPAEPRHRVGQRGADLHEDAGDVLRVQPFGQLGRGDPRNAGPLGAGRVRGRRGQQLQPLGGPAGGGEQVGAGDDRPHEGVVVDREEIEATAARCGEPGQRLVHLWEGGRPRQRAGEVAGGVVQVALVQCQPGQRQLLRRGERGVVRSLGHVVLSSQARPCAAGQA